MTTTAPDGWSAFRKELLAIREDPQVKRLAWRRAGDPDLAEDALQTAYWAVARVADPVVIRDLRAYFCRVLIREIYRLRGQLGAALVEDFTSLADAHQGRAGGNPPIPQPVAETVGTRLLAQAWRRLFAAQRGELTARVPSRSPDPGRYRKVIVAVAEFVLGIAIFEVISDAHCNAALHAAYPEWFAEPGCAGNTCHQRFRRARGDVRALLRTIISRDDLYP